MSSWALVSDLKQYLITVSTPNSRIERTTQVRVAKQSSQQRTVVKADVQSPVMSFGASVELVHDNRQYSTKTEVASRDQSRKQWRHAFEAGCTSGASSNSGRLAQFSYKPYVSIDSTELSRPIQMQGQFAYRALMIAAYQGDEQKNESAKEQMAQQIVKHCATSSKTSSSSCTPSRTWTTCAPASSQSTRPSRGPLPRTSSSTLR